MLSARSIGSISKVEFLRKRWPVISLYIYDVCVISALPGNYLSSVRYTLYYVYLAYNEPNLQLKC